MNKIYYTEHTEHIESIQELERERNFINKLAEKSDDRNLKASLLDEINHINELISNKRNINLKFLYD